MSARGAAGPPHERSLGSIVPLVAGVEPEADGLSEVRTVPSPDGGAYVLAVTDGPDWSLAVTLP